MKKYESHRQWQCQCLRICMQCHYHQEAQEMYLVKTIQEVCMHSGTAFPSQLDLSPNYTGLDYTLPFLLFRLRIECDLWQSTYRLGAV